MSYAPNFPPPDKGFAPPPEMNVGFQPHVVPQPTSHPMPQPQHHQQYQPQPQAPYPDHSYQPQPPYNPQPHPPYSPPPSAQGGYQPPPSAQGGYQPPSSIQGGYPYPPNSGYQPGAPGPVVSQPFPMGDPGGWMNTPQNQLIPNCPPGLEYLTTIDQLLVKQKVELLEAFTGFETNNKFTIKNSLGQKVYWAVEENDCCTRNCCGPARPFDMKIMDAMKNQVIHMNRPLACSTCWFPCCLQSMEVSAPPGNVVGRVEQEWSLCFPSFAIKNHMGETVLRIEGPLCTFSLCGDVEFKIVTMNGDEVGKISKQWSGLAREMFTDADFFGISFPMDLDVRMKAVMLGACFLIDAMFFEKAQNQEQDRPGMF